MVGVREAAEKRRRVDAAVAYMDEKRILHSLVVGLVLFIWWDMQRPRPPVHAHADAQAQEEVLARQDRKSEAAATRAGAKGRKKSD